MTDIVCYLDPAALDINTKSARIPTSRGDFVFEPNVPRSVPEEVFPELEKARSRPTVEHPNGRPLLKRGLPKRWEEWPEPAIVRRVSYRREGAKLIFGGLVPWVRPQGNRLVFTPTPGIVTASADGKRIQIKGE